VGYSDQLWMLECLPGLTTFPGAPDCLESSHMGPRTRPRTLLELLIAYIGLAYVPWTLLGPLLPIEALHMGPGHSWDPLLPIVALHMDQDTPGAPYCL
jgi:hypothetical protein